MSKEIAKLINDYRTNAEKHGAATTEGDHKTANKFHNKLLRTLKMLRAYGNDADLALLSLIEEENESVRCWAATHSLKYDAKKAEKVLRNLQKQNGPIAFDAEMVLSEWKKGTLEIP